MKNKKNMVWVGALNDHPENAEIVYYIPYECDKECIYGGVDAIPYFFSREECQVWCDNNKYDDMKKKLKCYNTADFTEAEFEFADFHYYLAEKIHNACMEYTDGSAILPLMVENETRIVIGVMEPRNIGDIGIKYKITIEKI